MCGGEGADYAQPLTLPHLKFYMIIRAPEIEQMNYLINLYELKIHAHVFQYWKFRTKLILSCYLQGLQP